MRGGHPEGWHWKETWLVSLENIEENADLPPPKWGRRRRWSPVAPICTSVPLLLVLSCLEAVKELDMYRAIPPPRLTKRRSRLETGPRTSFLSFLFFSFSFFLSCSCSSYPTSSRLRPRRGSNRSCFLFGDLLWGLAKPRSPARDGPWMSSRTASPEAWFCEWEGPGVYEMGRESGGLEAVGLEMVGCN